MINPTHRLTNAFKCFHFPWTWCFGLLMAATLSLPAVPPNDLCNSAEVIPSNQGFPYWTIIRDITGATTNGDPVINTNGCFDYDISSRSRSVWYTFTPAQTRQYLISTCADAPTATTVPDTLMVIYSSVNGCVGPVTQIADGCADDSCGPGFLQAAITTILQAGLQYYIVVWRFDNTVPSPDNSSLQLLIDLATPPANDRCENATALTLNQPIHGRTVLASNDYEVASSSFAGTAQHVSTAGGRDVVYSFMAPATASYSFRVSNFDKRNSDPVLYVTDACPTGPKPITISNCLAVASRTVFGSTEEIYCLHMIAGQNVFIIVDDDADDLSMTPGSSFIIEAALCYRENEPNNTTATANVPFCGLEGAIDSGGDVDMYSLGIPATGSRLFALVDGSASELTDITMRVITANGTLEFDAGNNDEAFGNLSSNIAGTPLTNLPTYLRISHSFGVSEPYRLYAVIQPPLANATLEAEPNNYLGQANSGDNNYFYGALANSADIDSFQFEADAGDVVFISLDTDPLRNNSSFNASLELLDEAGNVLVHVDDSASSSQSTSINTSTNSGSFPFSPGEGLACRVANTASYFARVMIGVMPGGATSGDYLLSISRNGLAGNSGQPPQPELQSVIPLVNGHYQITAVGIPGVTYRFEATAALGSPWTPLAGSGRVANGDGTFQFEDTTPAIGQRFYRILWP